MGNPYRTFKVADATAADNAVALGQAYSLGFLELEVPMPVIVDLDVAPLGWGIFDISILLQHFLLFQDLIV